MIDEELPQRRARPVVHGENLVAGEALEEAVLDHLACATAELLGGLKDEVQRALPVFILSEGDSGTEQHGGVAVVTAAMHLSRRARTVGKLVLFGQRQRVHVGAQAEARPLATSQRADHTGFTDRFRNFKAVFTQDAGHQFRRGDFLECGFRVGVNQMTPVDHGVDQGLGDHDGFLFMESEVSTGQYEWRGRLPRFPCTSCAYPCRFRAWCG